MKRENEYTVDTSFTSNFDLLIKNINIDKADEDILKLYFFMEF